MHIIYRIFVSSLFAVKEMTTSQRKQLICVHGISLFPTCDLQQPSRHVGLLDEAMDSLHLHEVMALMGQEPSHIWTD